MARLPRLVVPDHPHHVTQRGNRRQNVFFCEDDYALYLDLMAQSCKRYPVKVWSYCLMPNHVHLIMLPGSEDSLARCVGETHRRYSAYINARHRQSGHLFQGRFNSRVMDEQHLFAAARYIAMNPVKAGLVKRAEDWRWSSTAAQLAGKNDVLVSTAPLRRLLPDFSVLLEGDADREMEARIEADQTIGRPLMGETALIKLEKKLGLQLRPKKRGRPAKTAIDS